MNASPTANRFLAIAIAVTGLIGSACGSSGGGIFGDGGGSGDDASVSQDATADDGPGTIFGGDSGSLCKPKTCADLGYTCGPNGDGCGGTLDCGTCTAPEYCGGGGYSKCGGSIFNAPDGAPRCTPKQCSDYGYTCGPAADGCGGLLQCGSCTAPAFCGGGGFNVCGLGDAGTNPDGGSICPAKSCADQGFDCGQAGDGCGGTIDCGTCTAAAFCGGGGANKCGGSTGTLPDGGIVSPCVATTCSKLGYTCGPAGDGCGGSLDCGTCSATQYCGGGGFDRCGGTRVVDAGADASTCVPQTCASLGYNCGPAADGCGGLLQCGTCTSPQYCGGRGFNLCGGNINTLPDGAVVAPCQPASCATLGYDCGQAGDGCGGTLSCGTCSGSEYCGGSGANKCGGTTGTLPDGGPVPCTPSTCASLGYNCGQAGDGCGGSLSCGTCNPSEFCGGGGTNVCGGSSGLQPDGAVPCTPQTCTSLGYDCGQAADGCGGTLDCGSTCPLAGEICGGSGVANKCGSTVACTGLCLQQQTCDGGALTTITGQVVGGTTGTGFGSPDPVPNVLVYVPNDLTSLASIPAGASCGSCSSNVTGSPLVSTTTAFDGTFSLSNVPVGSNIPLIIQLGKWRRGIYVNVTSACTTSALPYTIHMPRTQAGATTAAAGDYPDIAGATNIPLTAISTGNADPIECVLRKMGVADTEFTNNGGSGRIHIYKGNGAGISGANGESTLFHTGDSGGTYSGYDQILLPCWGYAASKTSNQLSSLVSYSTNGGRFFATHFSYTWLHGNTSGGAAPNNFDSTANWDLDYADVNSITGNVSTAVPTSNPGSFAAWLGAVGALATTNPPTITINAARHDADSVAGAGVKWIDGTDNACHNKQELLHYTFDTPLGGTSACGHAIYSDFHVNTGGSGSGGNGCGAGSSTAGSTATFPNECGGNSAMTSQERVLEFMIWDLSSCASTSGPTCTKRTCAQQNSTCGPTGDGCGGLIPGGCGTCTAPQTCGGGGVPSQCGYPDGGACAPKTCTQQGFNCGAAGDGCGNLIPGGCGTCPSGQTCGGGGTPNVCGSPDAGACVPRTCTQQNIGCGPAGDGCGNLIAGGCGNCTPPQTCGGAGVHGQCGTPPDGGSCVPRTCKQQNLSCGPAGDGCGNLIPGGCGTCPSGQTCGGGGVPGQCGAPDAGACIPQTCTQQGIACGPAGDGCGNLIPGGCGTCPPGTACGAGGVPGQCGAPDAGACVPQTCAQQNIACGPAGDGCGNLIPGGCGPCPTGQTCGGGGVPGQCGGPTCTSLTCAQQGFNCGPAGDGCGNQIDCGPCTAPQTCGGGGTPGVCGGGGACTPLTCSGLGLNCGPAGDGCGGLLQCGTCTAPLTCGGGGQPGVCGGGSQ